MSLLRDSLDGKGLSDETSNQLKIANRNEPLVFIPVMKQETWGNIVRTYNHVFFIPLFLILKCFKALSNSQNYEAIIIYVIPNLRRYLIRPRYSWLIQIKCIFLNASSVEIW